MFATMNGYFRAANEMGRWKVVQALSVVLCAGAGMAFGQGAGVPAGDATPVSRALETISESDLMRHVRFLADDGLEGRESGSPGNERVAEYLASEFKRIGLEPAGSDGSWFQLFEIGLNPEIGEGCELVWNAGGDSGEAVRGRDFLPFDNLDSGTAEAGLAFVGYGIQAPEEDYDDYAGIDVMGKLVLMLRKTPRDGREDAVFGGSRGRPSEHAYFTMKLSKAKEQGAAGILIVDATPERQAVTELAKGGPFRMGEQKDSLPFAFVSAELADRWLQTAGTSLTNLVGAIDEEHAPRSVVLEKVSVRLSVDIERKRAEIRNVLGWLPGSDPDLRHEHVVIGGHFDHIGYGPDRANAGKPEFIHNGADDNASGTAVVLEVAEAFANSGFRPKRSLLFIGFNAEERGLLGSRHYVDQPLKPLSNIVAMINLDMVGRGASGLDVGGVGTSPGFKAMIESLAEPFPFSLSTHPGGKAPSDNTSFYNKDIPVLFFYTGRHDDYHRPSDDWEKIDRVEFEQIARLAWLTAERLANAGERPEFAKSDGNPTRRGRTRVLLGVVLEPVSEGEGLVVGHVADDSAAARAGVQPGDVLQQLDGKAVGSVTEVTRFLGRKRSGDRAVATILRGRESLRLEVRF